MVIFSFAKWIKEQELPQEMKSYCKNVLNFLAHQGDNPFLALQGEDDENEEEEDTEEEKKDGEYTKFQLETLQAHNDLRSSGRNNMKNLTHL